MTAPPDEQRPLVVHVLYRLDTGGLENGVVNLINHLPASRLRHAVICLAGYTDFAQRIRRDEVELYALNKRAGKDPIAYLRLWRLLRRLRPAIVHTRNLGTLDVQLIAALAGVPRRVHGEHGWEADDVDARSRRNLRLRRLFRPLVHQYVGLSRHIGDYLTSAVGVAPPRLRQIYNGVDTERFHPAEYPPGPARDAKPTTEASPTAEEKPPVGAAYSRDPHTQHMPSPYDRRAGPPREWVRERFGRDDVYIIGTVGRLEAVKNPVHLARAFIRLAIMRPGLTSRLRLVLVGEGRLRDELERMLAGAGLSSQCWLAGNRDDVPELMRGFDLFVLPSLAEGVSNTILEAMASGLPVVATSVGGNPELVVPGETGMLVPAADVDAMAAAIAAYAGDSALGATHGAAGRRRVEARFSLPTMVAAYQSLYEDMLAGTAPGAAVHREPGV